MKEAPNKPTNQVYEQLHLATGIEESRVGGEYTQQ